MAALQVLTLLTEKLNSAAMALVLTPFCSLVLTASRVSWDIGAGIATFAAHFGVNNFDVRRMQNLGEAVTDEASVDEFAEGATRTGNATAQPPNPGLRRNLWPNCPSRPSTAATGSLPQPQVLRSAKVSWKSTVCEKETRLDFDCRQVQVRRVHIDRTPLPRIEL